MDVAETSPFKELSKDSPAWRDWLPAAAAAAVAAVVSVLLWLHTPGVNGPEWWRWWYRNPSTSFVVWFAVTLLPIVIAVMLQPRTPRTAAASVLAITLAGGALRAIVALHLQPAVGLREIEQIIRSDYATSYYYDGVRLIEYAKAREAAGGAPVHWLAHYDEFHPQTRVHTATKPAGGVMYWMAWRAIMGDAHAPLAGAIALMAVTSLAPPLVWLTAIRLGIAARTAMLAAALMAVSPGFLLSTPSFDAAYPIFTCGLILTWMAAVERKSLMAVVASGLILFVGTLMSLHLLCIGLAVVAAPWLAGRQPATQLLRRSAVLAIAVLAVTIVLYAILWLLSGYSAVAVIRSCFKNQAAWAADNPQWFTPMASFYNLSDGALGVGWPVALAFAAALCSKAAWRASRQLVWIVAATIALASGAHMLPAEVARVWVFLTPLVVIPAGAFIESLSDRPRATVVLSVAVTSLATCATLKFILGSLPAPP